MKKRLLLILILMLSLVLCISCAEPADEYAGKPPAKTPATQIGDTTSPGTDAPAEDEDTSTNDSTEDLNASLPSEEIMPEFGITATETLSIQNAVAAESAAVVAQVRQMIPDDITDGNYEISVAPAQYNSLTELQTAICNGWTVSVQEAMQDRSIALTYQTPSYYVPDIDIDGFTLCKIYVTAKTMEFCYALQSEIDNLIRWDAGSEYFSVQIHTVPNSLEKYIGKSGYVVDDDGFVFSSSMTSTAVRFPIEEYSALISVQSSSLDNYNQETLKSMCKVRKIVINTRNNDNLVTE